jgi:hypothetical protein
MLRRRPGAIACKLVSVVRWPSGVFRITEKKSAPFGIAAFRHCHRARMSPASRVLEIAMGRPFWPVFFLRSRNTTIKFRLRKAARQVGFPEVESRRFFC